MNHFAHLVLSQPTIESTVGNLLGDFARGIDMNSLDPGVHAGLLNHRAVDRFTDGHPQVQRMKHAFSPTRRRFAGIALDIYFDHLLIVNWRQLEDRNLENLMVELYQRIDAGQGLMPGENMQRVTQRMIEYDWFGSYRDIDAIADSIDQVAGRIRFANRFENAIEELLDNQEMIGDGFLEFYPQLQQQVENLAIEAR